MRFKDKIGYLIAFAILGILFYKIDLNLFKTIVKEFRFIYLIPIFILRGISIYLNGINIKILLSRIKKINNLNMFKYQTTEFIGSFFIPFSGATILKIYLLFKKEDIKPSISTSAILLDKTISLFIIILVLFIGLARYFSFRIALNTIYLISFILLIIYIIFYSKKTNEQIKRIIPRKYLNKIKGITTFYRVTIKEDKKLILANIITTSLNIILAGIISFLGFKAIGQNINLIDTILISNIALLAKIVQITPGGHGIMESIGAYLFSLLQIPITATLTMYGILFITKAILGIILLFILKLNPTKAFLNNHNFTKR